jgi:hypothetical protein
MGCSSTGIEKALEQRPITFFISPYYLLYLESLRTIQPFPNSQEKKLGNGAP